MDLYSIVLFVHIAGAMCYFAAFALEFVSLAYMRRASIAEQVRQWLGLRNWLQPIGLGSLVVILPSGFYMMATAVGWQAWILIALAVLVLIAVLGATLTGIRIRQITHAVLTERGQLSPDFRQRLRDPWLWTSIQTRLALALGIVFVMTVKPGLLGSLVAIAVAAVLGVASSLPAWRRATAEGDLAAPRA